MYYRSIDQHLKYIKRCCCSCFINFVDQFHGATKRCLHYNALRIMNLIYMTTDGQYVSQAKTNTYTYNHKNNF